MKLISEYTLDEFLQIKKFPPKTYFDGVIIVPTGEMHKSGWGSMKFILAKGEKIVGVVGGGSDVVNINGIGGYGLFYDMHSFSKDQARRIGWCIDCLPKSGCVRLFCFKNLIIDPIVTSSFEIYAIENERTIPQKTNGTCPRCYRMVRPNEWYCFSCGQALDWEEK